MSIQIIASHFPDLTQQQLKLLEDYVGLLLEQNNHVNLISRKSDEDVWVNHILHSLAIAKVVEFAPNQKVLDVGTGGGLPGIPLAILFPNVQFHLVDSIGKKIRAVNEIIRGLGLKNVVATQVRVEEMNERFDFVVSRAVTALPKMKTLLHNRIRKGEKGSLPNGLIYLKGGDFDEELLSLKVNFRIWNHSDWFTQEFFETKKVVWIALAS